MADAFATYQPGLDDPPAFGAAVTPHDTDELATHSRKLYIGGAGAVKVTTTGGSTITFSAVPVGTTLNVRAKIVFSTGTTATNILALW